MIRKLFVVDDHEIVRDGYRYLFDGVPDLTVCGEAADATAALTAISETAPDLVVTDLALEGPSGFELVKDLVALQPDLPVLVVSMHDETLYAERALRAGARGYVMKGELHEVILEAVRELLAGRVYLSPQMNARLLRRFMEGDTEEARAPIDRLTDRELETFELLGRGLSSRRVAEAMHISPKTVGTYRRRIKEKLGLDDGAQLIQRAVAWVQRQTAPSGAPSDAGPAGPAD